MKKYALKFLHRGALFAGFGPIILGIIYFVLSNTVENFALSGKDILIGIISTYFLAFVHAGASVFNEIEHFSIPQSVLCHLSVLYVAYVVCYLINSWIAFDWKVILIFTAIFLVVYAVIWSIVFISVKMTLKKLNKNL